LRSWSADREEEEREAGKTGLYRCGGGASVRIVGGDLNVRYLLSPASRMVGKAWENNMRLQKESRHGKGKDPCNVALCVHIKGNKESRLTY
jgi:hypothetical protein